MTQEEKAKAYDEVVNKLRRFMEQGIDPLITRADVQDFFPELKESEDERVRKAIIHFISHTPTVPKGIIGKKTMLAWLEKQGEQKASCTTIVETGNGGINALVTEELPTNDCDDEQNLADKVEPKFKVGDLIKHNKANIICKVISVNSGSYYVENIETSGRIELFNAEQNFHLWTIQDAKDGDVLAYITDEEDLWIMIYWSLYEPYEGHVHYHALLVNDNFSDKGTCCICINDLKPATKEQRELLFSKMKEARYEWDAKRKKLKNIDAKENLTLDGDLMEADCMIAEQKPAWSEEDDYNVQCLVAKVVSDIQNGNVGRNQELIDWLKSLKQKIGG